MQANYEAERILKIENSKVQYESKNMTFRLGILASHIDARPDLLQLVELLTKDERAVFLQRSSSTVNLGSKKPRLLRGDRRNFLARIAARLFHLFGQIPRSYENYLIAEIFKLCDKSYFKQLTGKLRARVRVLNPVPFRLKSYHRLIANIDKTKIDDLDVVLLVSEITDDALVARLRAEGKPTFLYVYSWDHPCKHGNIPADLEGYFVWNQGVANDLVKLAGVPSERIHVVGATQMAPLYEFRENWVQAAQKDRKTIYFGSAMGYPALARIEIKIARAAYNICREFNCPFRFLFRPYPFLANWSEYDELENLPEFKFDTWERPKGDRWRTMSSDVVQHRFQRMAEADAFLHLGTTMGLECCFLNTPSILIDAGKLGNFPSELCNPLLRDFCDQYHLNEHMKFEDYPNLVRSVAGLREVLQQVFETEDSTELLRYNEHVVQGFSLHSLESLSEDILHQMTVPKSPLS